MSSFVKSGRWISIGCDEARRPVNWAMDFFQSIMANSKECCSKNSLLRNLLLLATISWWALTEPSWQWKVKSVNPSWILDFLMGTWSWNLIKFPTNPDGSEFSDLKILQIKVKFFQYISRLTFSSFELLLFVPFCLVSVLFCP